MNVLIIEDEKLAARKLERMLSVENLNIVDKLTSVTSSIEWFKTNEHPDLIFLDIQLSDGLSFEIFENIEVHSHIIFTTAFDEYALKAFKLNSIDYLLKPIDEDELHSAINKFRQYKNNNTSNINSSQLEQIKILLNNTQQQYKERFTVKVGPHIHSVPTNNIECFYSENKATYIHTNSGKNYLIDYSLEQLDELLYTTAFHRINRKFIINIDSMEDIIAYSNSRLKIKLKSYKEEDIIVSRERVKGFKEWLG